MATSESAFTVGALWRFPVKSMGGERIERAPLTARGLVGDRAHALIDVATGKVVSAKSVKLFPDLLSCRATFVEPPRPDAAAPPVRIVLPDGRSVRSDQADTSRLLSSFFGREVRLAQAAPEDFTIDQYHPDVEGADPTGHRDTVVAQKLGSAFFAQAGLASPVPVGSFFDLFPFTVISTSTLAQFAAFRPESRFDPRRFRMNLIVETGEAGFVENGWVGRSLAIGDTARLKVTLPDPRCVMTTLAQGELPADTDILRTLVRHNRLDIPGAGPFPCAGVYAVVEAPGTIGTGDRLTLA